MTRTNEKTNQIHYLCLDNLMNIYQLFFSRNQLRDIHICCICAPKLLAQRRGYGYL